MPQYRNITYKDETGQVWEIPIDLALPSDKIPGVIEGYIRAQKRRQGARDRGELVVEGNKYGKAVTPAEGNVPGQAQDAPAPARVGGALADAFNPATYANAVRHPQEAIEAVLGPRATAGVRMLTANPMNPTQRQDPIKVDSPSMNPALSMPENVARSIATNAPGIAPIGQSMVQKADEGDFAGMMTDAATMLAPPSLRLPSRLRTAITGRSPRTLSLAGRNIPQTMGESGMLGTTGQKLETMARTSKPMLKMNAQRQGILEDVVKSGTKSLDEASTGKNAGLLTREGTDVDKLTNITDYDVAQINEIKASLTPESYNRLMARSISEIVDEAIDPLTGEMKGASISEAFEAIGKEKLRAMANGSAVTLGEIEAAARLMDKLQKDGTLMRKMQRITLPTGFYQSPASFALRVAGSAGIGRLIGEIVTRPELISKWRRYVGTGVGTAAEGLYLQQFNNALQKAMPEEIRQEGEEGRSSDLPIEILGGMAMGDPRSIRKLFKPGSLGEAYATVIQAATKLTALVKDPMRVIDSLMSAKASTSTAFNVTKDMIDRTGLTTFLEGKAAKGETVTRREVQMYLSGKQIKAKEVNPDEFVETRSPKTMESLKYRKTTAEKRKAEKIKAETEGLMRVSGVKPIVKATDVEFVGNYGPNKRPLFIKKRGQTISLMNEDKKYLITKKQMFDEKVGAFRKIENLNPDPKLVEESKKLNDKYDKWVEKEKRRYLTEFGVEPPKSSDFRAPTLRSPVVPDPPSFKSLEGYLSDNKVWLKKKRVEATTLEGERVIIDAIPLSEQFYMGSRRAGSLGVKTSADEGQRIVRYLSQQPGFDKVRYNSATSQVEWGEKLISPKNLHPESIEDFVNYYGRAYGHNQKALDEYVDWARRSFKTEEEAIQALTGRLGLEGVK